jgi:hypothetical protein
MTTTETTASVTLADAAAATIAPYVHVSTVAPNPVGDLPSVRLDLYANPEFPRKFGARVRAMGGNFTECRGSNHTRFVTFKLSGDLPGDVTPEEVVMLINEICADATPVHLGSLKTKTFTFVFDLPRGCKTGDAHSWICVQQGRNFFGAARAFIRSYEEAVGRKLAPTVAEMWAATQAERAEQTSREMNLDAVRNIPGVIASTTYQGRFELPLANGLSLSLTANARGISIEGLSPFMGRVFTTTEVIALAAAIGGVAL